MQRVDRLLPELRQAGGMPCRRSFCREFFVFACVRVRRAELFELPSHVLLLALAAGPKLLEVANLAAGLDPRRISDGDRGPLLHRARIPVEQLGLRLAVEQRVVLVLAVQRHQVASELAQRLGGRRPSVDARRASLAQLPLQHQRNPVGLERAFDGRSVGSVADLVGAASRSKGQAQRVDDQGLAAAGFARQEVEARTEADPALGDQGKVADPELVEHYCLTISWEPGAGPSRAFRPAGGRTLRAG